MTQGTIVKIAAASSSSMNLWYRYHKKYSYLMCPCKLKFGSRWIIKLKITENSFILVDQETETKMTIMSKKDLIKI